MKTKKEIEKKLKEVKEAINEGETIHDLLIMNKEVPYSEFYWWNEPAMEGIVDADYMQMKLEELSKIIGALVWVLEK